MICQLPKAPGLWHPLQQGLPAWRAGAPQPGSAAWFMLGCPQSCPRAFYSQIPPYQNGPSVKRPRVENFCSPSMCLVACHHHWFGVFWLILCLPQVSHCSDTGQTQRRTCWRMVPDHHLAWPCPGPPSLSLQQQLLICPHLCTALKSLGPRGFAKGLLNKQVWPCEGRAILIKGWWVPRYLGQDVTLGIKPNQNSVWMVKSGFAEGQLKDCVALNPTLALSWRIITWPK